MNMDYSKVLELLNQDTEKERNEKAKKAVYDNLYNKGFRDGLAVLDKIRAEINAIEISGQIDEHTLFARSAYEVKNMALNIIDKCRNEASE